MSDICYMIIGNMTCVCVSVCACVCACVCLEMFVITHVPEIITESKSQNRFISFESHLYTCQKFDTSNSVKRFSVYKIALLFM